MTDNTENDNDILLKLGYSKERENEDLINQTQTLTTQTQTYSKLDSTSESELGFLFDDSQELAEIESLMSNVHPSPHETNIVNQVDDLIGAYQYISEHEIKPSEQDIENVTQLLKSRELNKTFETGGGSVGRSAHKDTETVNDYLNQKPNQTRVPSSKSILFATLSLALVSTLFAFVGYWAIVQSILPSVVGSLSIAVFILIAVSSFITYIQFKDEFTNS